MRKSVSIAVVAGLLVLAWYGSFLPMQKSYAYIGMLQSLGRVQSWDEFYRLATVPLEMMSPIGQEELARNFGGTVAMRIVQTNGADSKILEQIFAMVDRYMQPLLKRGGGQSLSQNVYMLGALNQTAYLSSKNPKYLDDAAKYYGLGLERSPKRPQFLYSLFDIYRTKGDRVKAREYAEKINAIWPEDARLGAALLEMDMVAASSTTSTKKKAK